MLYHVFLYMYFTLRWIATSDSLHAIGIKAQIKNRTTRWIIYNKCITWIHRAADHADRRISVLQFHTISAKWRLQNNEEAAQRQRRWCLKSSIYSSQPEIAERTWGQSLLAQRIGGQWLTCTWPCITVIDSFICTNPLKLNGNWNIWDLSCFISMPP